jgi:hypothetical protein
VLLRPPLLLLLLRLMKLKNLHQLKKKNLMKKPMKIWD